MRLGKLLNKQSCAGVLSNALLPTTKYNKAVKYALLQNSPWASLCYQKDVFLWVLNVCFEQCMPGAVRVCFSVLYVLSSPMCLVSTPLEGITKWSLFIVP